jgi:hypothetical protein
MGGYVKILDSKNLFLISKVLKKRKTKKGPSFLTPHPSTVAGSYCNITLDCMMLMFNVHA